MDLYLDWFQLKYAINVASSPTWNKQMSWGVMVMVMMMKLV